MFRRRVEALLALLCLSLIALSLSMCGGGGSDNKKPAVTEGSAKLTVTASPTKVPADGTTSDIAIAAVQDDGTNGTGTVTVQVTNGNVDGAPTTKTVDLANGRATVKWNCDEKATSACRGVQTLTAKWNDKSATTTVEFTATTTEVVDSGPPDASDAGPVTDGGIVDSGTGVLGLDASKPRLYIGANDFATLTATLKRPDGGPIANEPLSFATDLGRLGGADGGTTFDTTTAANGTAQVALYDNGVVGTATATVTRTATGQNAQTQVAILGATQIVWQSTKCNNATCTIMGIKGSGFNESAIVTFKVMDASNNPIANEPVSFTIDTPPSGTTVTASGTTDGSGLVSATVTSGLTPGSFVVTATVDSAATSADAGVVSGSSAPIGIRGALPSNNGFSFQCARVNIDAYNSQTPPLAVTVQCTVKLVDRYNNSVGTGASVTFKTEAGTLPATVQTAAYVAGGNNTSEGTATVTFNTTGVFPAQDVPPLAALVGQFPKDRPAEPSYMDGLIQRNPRDGLVSLLAEVKGEEHFSDDNQNGVRDSGEQFIDQGEPFVDKNDNGVWDPGEYYDDVNNNNSWDGPNGTWDAHTTIWTETRVLYTGPTVVTNSTVSPASAWTIAAGTSQQFSVSFRDLNLNYVSAVSTVSTSFTGTTRSLTTSVQGPLVDRYGMEIQRVLVASGTELTCQSSTPICKWKYVFTDWAGAYPSSLYKATIGNPVGATPSGGSTTIHFNITLGSTTQQVDTTGTIGN